MMAVLEEDVLKPTPRPKNSASINSDDWPTFYLSKGSVVSQKDGEPVSLLSAHKSHPVKVTGILRVPDDARHLGKGLGENYVYVLNYWLCSARSQLYEETHRAVECHKLRVC